MPANIEQLHREAWAGLDRLDATLANMPPLLVTGRLTKRFWRYQPAVNSWEVSGHVEVSADVAACAAVEGRAIGAGEGTI